VRPVARSLGPKCQTGKALLCCAPGLPYCARARQRQPGKRVGQRGGKRLDLLWRDLGAGLDKLQHIVSHRMLQRTDRS
jgi:hypothetical protein